MRPLTGGQGCPKPQSRCLGMESGHPWRGCVLMCTLQKRGPRGEGESHFRSAWRSASPSPGLDQDAGVPPLGSNVTLQVFVLDENDPLPHIAPTSELPQGPAKHP